VTHWIAVNLAIEGALILALMMFFIWLVYLRTNNAGFVDVGWSLGLPILAVLYALGAEGAAQSPRMWLLTGMVVVWGVRLGGHLLSRILREPEDGRYREIRRNWQHNLKLKFLLFFEFQAILDVVLSIPFLLVALDHAQPLSVFEYAGVFLWMVAVVGESIADAQLVAFKRDPQNRGKVCQYGLWNFSRHPNYFFEWFVWIAWAVYAWPSRHGWLAWLSPVLMIFFLYRVTGIPATEAQSLRSRGELYRRYQQTTSAFVPWFKTKAEPEK
jgi:steroid 5-alpha reductase family enzyme